MKIKKTEMMKQAEKIDKDISGFGMQIMCFLGVFLVITILQSIPTVIMMFQEMANLPEFNEQVLSDIMTKFQNASGNMLIIMLFSTIATVIIPILYCKFIEKRSLSSMGIVKKHIIRRYLLGIIIGLIMFSAVVFLNVCFGGMEFAGINSNIAISSIIVLFIGFIIQGMGEEILCRGYLMNSIGAKHSIMKAILTSSAMFALLHIFNPGLTVLAVINLVLFGIFAALYMICFDNIWGICAIHTIWNFAQGIIYGISISGAYNIDNSIFLFKNIEGKTLINGGAFGAEGGIAVTIVLTLGILIIFGIMRHKKKIEDDK